MANPPSEVRGTVEAVNEKGFKFMGGNWVNYSPYGYQGPNGATNPTPAPNVGQYVVAQIKNNKFLHALTIGGTGPSTVTPQPMPQAQVIPQVIQAPPSVLPATNMDTLVKTRIETRLAIMKVMGIAQPNMFTLDNGDTLIETIRNLELFVLEDLLSANEPELDDDEDITADDLDESI